MPSDPGLDPSDQMERSGPPSDRSWQTTALGILALIGLALVVVLLVFPLPGPESEQPASAVKHPPYTPGTSCSAPDCHDDFVHRQPYDDKNCERCHIADSWTFVSYSHRNRQMNLGVHPVLGCENCHVYGEPPPEPGCDNCHRAKSPHKYAAFRRCANCHQALGWQFIHLPANHPALVAGHANLGCTDCHNRMTFGVPKFDCGNCHGPKHGYSRGCNRCHDVARYWNVDRNSINHDFFPFGIAHVGLRCERCHPGLRFVGVTTDCAGCHGPNHGFSGNCERCHSVFLANWKIKHFNHNFYPLKGRHGGFDCESCHPRLQFVGASPTCTRCHSPVHGEGFSTKCFECHETGTFQIAGFDHSKLWRYWSGAHTKLACSACHPNGLVFGSVKGTYCTACHGNRHGLTSRCTECHNTTSFAQVHFDHSFWYYYTGDHRRVSCSRCHERNGRLDFADPPSPRCRECHGLRHGSCLIDCQRCHNTSSFADTHFDHQSYWSDYTGTHTTLACDSCHGANLQFCPLPPTNCNAGACHGDQHGFASNVCDSCHTTSAFWPLRSAWTHTVGRFSGTSYSVATPIGGTVTFSSGSLISLGGFHAQNNVRVDGSSRCDLCHTTYNFVNAPRACDDCHDTDVPHGISFQTASCIGCHWPTGWTDLHFSHENTEQVGTFGRDVWIIHEEFGFRDTCTNCHPGGNFDQLQCTPCHVGIPTP